MPSNRNDHTTAATEDRRNLRRFSRYGPLLAWTVLIFVASTGELSATNTSRIIRPLLLWLFPEIGEATIGTVHFWVRKTAHFLEYGILALLAARAFATSSHNVLRRRFFSITLAVVATFALLDEFHQSLISSRTGSIYDSLIDIAGGACALVLYSVRRRPKRESQIQQVSGVDRAQEQ